MCSSDLFGKTVLGIDAEHFEHVLEARKQMVGAKSDVDLNVEDLKAVVADYKMVVKTHAGRDFPQDVREQLELAIHAVFDSWNTDRAKLYRRQERIPEDLGTAVNVCTMVFGNRGESSGTGVAFTRDPASGSTGEDRKSTRLNSSHT